MYTLYRYTQEARDAIVAADASIAAAAIPKKKPISNSTQLSDGNVQTIGLASVLLVVGVVVSALV